MTQAVPAPAAPAPAASPAQTPQAPATPAPSKSLLGQLAADAPKDAPKEASKETPKDAPKDAPKVYELKAPEGLEDQSLFAAYTKQANELGLSQEAAQKLIDTLHTQQATGLQARIEESKQAMAAAAQADPEYGGAKWNESKQTVARGMAALGVTPALQAIFDQTGLGSHPDVVRVFYRAGLKLSPDKIVGTEPAGAAPAEVHPAHVLYTTMQQKA